MVGIVIVTHGQLGEALVDTAEIIFGSTPESIISASINLTENVKQ